jgi:hypothetical protein
MIATLTQELGDPDQEQHDDGGTTCSNMYAVTKTAQMPSPRHFVPFRILEIVLETKEGLDSTKGQHMVHRGLTKNKVSEASFLLAAETITDVTLFCRVLVAHLVSGVPLKAIDCRYTLPPPESGVLFLYGYHFVFEYAGILFSSFWMQSSSLWNWHHCS